MYASHTLPNTTRITLQKDPDSDVLGACLAIIDPKLREGLTCEIRFVMTRPNQEPLQNEADFQAMLAKIDATWFEMLFSNTDALLRKQVEDMDPAQRALLAAHAEVSALIKTVAPF